MAGVGVAIRLNLQDVDTYVRRGVTSSNWKRHCLPRDRVNPACRHALERPGCGRSREVAAMLIYWGLMQGGANASASVHLFDAG